MGGWAGESGLCAGRHLYSYDITIRTCPIPHRQDHTHICTHTKLLHPLPPHPYPHAQAPHLSQRSRCLARRPRGHIIDHRDCHTPAHRQTSVRQTSVRASGRSSQRIIDGQAFGLDVDFSKFKNKFAMLANKEKFPEISHASSLSRNFPSILARSRECT